MLQNNEVSFLDHVNVSTRNYRCFREFFVHKGKVDITIRSGIGPKVSRRILLRKDRVKSTVRRVDMSKISANAGVGTSLASLKHVQLFHDLERDAVVVFVLLHLQMASHVRSQRNTSPKTRPAIEYLIGEGDVLHHRNVEFLVHFACTCQQRCC